MAIRLASTVPSGVFEFRPCAEIDRTFLQSPLLGAATRADRRLTGRTSLEDVRVDPSASNSRDGPSTHDFDFDPGQSATDHSKNFGCMT